MARSVRGSTARGRRTLDRFLRALFKGTFGSRKSNPPKHLDIPPEYVTDPYKPFPASFSNAKRQRISELREAYSYAMNRRFERKTLTSPELVADLLQPLMMPLETEVMMVIPLDARSRLIGEPITVSKGDVDGTDAGPRPVLRAVLQAGATSFIIAHNHPTGSPDASSADINVTRNISQASRVIGVPLVDHIIIGHGSFTSIRRDHAGAFDVNTNPRKRARSNPASTEGVLLGSLKELVVRADGEDVTIRPKKSLLGYLPEGKRLVVLKSGRRGRGDLSQQASKLHTNFHNTKPSRADRFEWPDPVGRRRDVGLIVSLLYTIPPWLESPEKRRYQWNHEFGDRGERGHGYARESGNYPERYMPMLQVDEKGNLFIRRRKGNRFYVKDWLYW